MNGIPEVKLLQGRVFTDDRGMFREIFRSDTAPDRGIPAEFVQDNYSTSRAGVLRGLHFQYERPQGKLVSVLGGRIFDVAVDLRRGSRTFGKWAGAELSAENGAQLWIPPGFAHGFLALEDSTVFYKCTAFYEPSLEATLRWNDPEVAVAWGTTDPILSAKDAAGAAFDELDLDRI